MASTTDASYFEGYRDIIPDWPEFVDCLGEPVPQTFWINPFKADRQTILDFLQNEGVEFSAMPWNENNFRVTNDARPGLTQAFRLGLIHAQEEVSMLPVHVLQAKPGDVALDLCAAPGNKSVQLSVQMQNRSTIVANDMHRERIKVVRTLVQRLGVCNITTTTFEGTSFPMDMQFDSILADVPCGCEGNVRRFTSKGKPLVSDFEPKLLSLQSALLKRAVDLCRPGGRILYSTCTFNPDENEVIVDQALRELPVQTLPIQLEGFTFSEGITRWGNRQLHETVKNSARIWPHQNNTGGFFLALLQKDFA